MIEHDKPVVEQIVKCDTCLKEIPTSNVKVVESADYVRHFCGLECFDKWKQQEQKPRT